MYESVVSEEESKGNEWEVEVIEQHIGVLINAGLQSQHIGVITPYNLQVKYIPYVNRQTVDFPKNLELTAPKFQL